jgi:hypothetical protein
MAKRKTENIIVNKSSRFMQSKQEKFDILMKCINKMDFQCFGEIYTSDKSTFQNIERILKHRIISDDQYWHFHEMLTKKCRYWLKTNKVFNKRYQPLDNAEDCAFYILDSLTPEIIQLRNEKNVIVDGLYHYDSELDFEDFLLMFKPKHHDAIMNEIDFSKPDSNISEQLLKSLLKFDGARAN